MKLKQGSFTIITNIKVILPSLHKLFSLVGYFYFVVSLGASDLFDSDCSPVFSSPAHCYLFVTHDTWSLQKCSDRCQTPFPDYGFLAAVKGSSLSRAWTLNFKFWEK